jgi:hypothetical protein
MKSKLLDSCQPLDAVVVLCNFKDIHIIAIVRLFTSLGTLLQSGLSISSAPIFPFVFSVKMPFLSQDHRPIPTKDILSWYFDEPQCNQDEPIYIDAADPSRFYTHRQARKTVRQIAAGLKAQGLRRGDCVCLHSFNDVPTDSGL